MYTSATLNTIQLIQQLLKDPDRKSIMRMMGELIYLAFIFKTIPRHYFSRFLFKKSRTNIRDYFPSKVLYNIKPHFNERGATEVLENKLFFDFYFRQFAIPLPKILMYNQRNVFVVDKKRIQIDTEAKFKELLEEVFKANTINSLFIKRTYGSYGGSKIYKLTMQQLLGEAQLVSTIFQEVLQAGYIFQETVRQHPVLVAFNPSCLNTLRIATFTNLDGKVEIINIIQRTSFTNSHVDNMTSGGCGIRVDPVTGKLDDVGYVSLKHGGIQIPVEHPVSHIAFHDLEIPFYEEAKQLIIRAAGCIPNLRLIGWDVAISESGPVLIEGNADYDIAGTDLITNGARSNPVFRKVLKEINYL